MSLTHEEIEYLIQFYRDHEVLYNKEHLDYNDRLNRKALIAEVAEKLGKTSESILAKIDGLRTQFSYALRRYRLKGAAGIPLERKWKYFDSLAFLERHMSIRVLSEDQEEYNQDDGMVDYSFINYNPENKDMYDDRDDIVEVIETKPMLSEDYEPTPTPPQPPPSQPPPPQPHPHEARILSYQHSEAPMHYRPSATITHYHTRNDAMTQPHSSEPAAEFPYSETLTTPSGRKRKPVPPRENSTLNADLHPQATHAQIEPIRPLEPTEASGPVPRSSDDCDAFGRLVAAELRGMSAQEKLVKKQQIVSILYDFNIS